MGTTPSGAGPSPLEEFRARKSRFFREDPGSPVEDRAGFPGLRFYPEDPAWVVEAEAEAIIGV